MTSPCFRGAIWPGRRLVAKSLLVVSAVLGLGFPVERACAQSEPGAGESGGCVLKNHVYTCDGAAFQSVLAGATTVGLETHNADGVARGQLKDLLTKKLGKTIAAEGSPADLIFLLMPVGEGGVIDTSPGDADLGTLRVYAAGPAGARGRLLWAETFAGQQDMPWPAVVHGLILKFQSHFHIK